MTKEQVIEQLKFNSAPELLTINESTTTSDISAFSSVVGALIEQKYKTSLAYELCSVQPLTSAAGQIFTLDKVADGSDWKFKVTGTPVTLLSKTTKTGFTFEAFTDMLKMFKKSAYDKCASILGKVSAEYETTQFLTVMKAAALSIGTAANTEEFFQLVGKAIAQINQKVFHSTDAWVLVPAKMAGYLMFNPNHFLSDSLDTQSQYLMYKFGKTRVYVNPDSTDTNVYVGVNDEEGEHSSLIFSPYQYTLNPAEDPDSGQTLIFSYDRFAITVNPLHKTNYEMICKFATTF